MAPKDRASARASPCAGRASRRRGAPPAAQVTVVEFTLALKLPFAQVTVVAFQLSRLEAELRLQSPSASARKSRSAARKLARKSLRPSDVYGKKRA